MIIVGDTLPTCPEGLFTCSNRNCIQQNLKCNGVDDCGDETDEMLDECGKY